MKPFFRRLLIAAAAIGALAALHGYLGIFEPGGRKFFAALLLSAAAFAAWRPGSRWHWTAAGAGCLMLLMHLPSPLFLAPVALACFARSESSQSLLCPLASAWFLFDMVELLRLETGFARLWIDAGASLGALFPGPTLGPTPLGLGFALFALLSVATIRCDTRGRVIAAVVFLLIVVLHGLVQLTAIPIAAMSAAIAAVAKEEGEERADRKSDSLVKSGFSLVRAVMKKSGLINASASLGIDSAPSRDSQKRGGGYGGIKPWVPAAVMAAGALLVIFQPLGASRPGKVLVCEPGMFSLEKPRHGQRLQEMTEGPYLGGLIDVLEAFGFEWERAKAPLPLDGAQIVVIANPVQPWPEREIDRLYEFMRGGGSVLLLGEHTDVMGVMRHANPIVSRAGIALNDDTTWPLDLPFVWGFYLDWVRHPALRAVRTEDEIQAGVGCSLELSAPARPLLIGRAGFGDAGNPRNEARAFLGNGRLDPGERSGDLVLAAESRVGRGRLVVFGDSLTFQNSYIPRTWPLVVSLFEYLRKPETSWPGRTIGLALMTGAAAMALWWRSIGACSLAAALALSPGGASIEPPPFRPKLPVAWIDTSHRPIAMRPMSVSPDSTDALVAGLYRNGFLPLFIEDLEDPRLFESKLLVVPAGASRWSSEEVTRLERYMSEGRGVVATAGYPERHGVEPLLERWGMRLVDRPLGNGGPDRRTIEAFGSKIRFYSCWPIELRSEGAAGVAAAFGERVAATARSGKGLFLLIGDSHFFSMKNLEGHGPELPVVEENFEFLKRLAEAVKGL